ncbi:hypothetical protein KP509_16G046000 [Ceratopteris richardii]|uniref:Uncharacterized protein n=1 Tax=Ceratopteris richardii TaxID=49495 RepID=A0A8T2T2M0_CERRI|nr:hypothetical protein KP509_16G046000 [Ceratopteris richardii]
MNMLGIVHSIVDQESSVWVQCRLSHVVCSLYLYHCQTRIEEGKKEKKRKSWSYKLESLSAFTQSINSYKTYNGNRRSMNVKPVPHLPLKACACMCCSPSCCSRVPTMQNIKLFCLHINHIHMPTAFCQASKS